MEDEKISTEESQNIIVELGNASEDTLYDENKVTADIHSEPIKPQKTKKKKQKKEFFWQKLTKKGKIIFISIVLFVLLLIIGILLYFFVFKKENNEGKIVDNVVIEKDNYIYENGVLKLLDKNDKVIGSYKCINKDAQKCYVAYLSNEDDFDTPEYLDEKSNKIEKRSSIYNDKFVFVYDDEKISLYDITKQTTTGEYDLIKVGNINDNYIIAKDKDGKYGMIEIKDNESSSILEFDYDYLGIIQSNSTFVAKDGAYSYLIDKEGNAKTSKLSGDIKNFSEEYISVYADEYILYDYKGNIAIEDEYDYIDFVSNYIFLMKNSKMYIYDNTLFKLNEVGFKIRSKDYNKTYIFDKDNELKETKKAYSITIGSGKISIEYDTEDKKVINTFEAEVNKKLDYVNYYEGILYFYEDTEKESLLGSYTCNNKNIVSSKDDTYKNCFVANDSDLFNKNDKGLIPIFNHEYAFIKDNADDSKIDNIILYDLKNSSQKARYSSVDTGLSTEKVTHVSASNNMIVAINKDGNMGAITFSSTGPTRLISFKDDDKGGNTKKISLFKDYLLVKRDTKNYLYDKNGKEIANSAFEIIDYIGNNMLVKDKNYLVYNIADGNIISDEFKYISLHDSIFASIDDDNKLNIYKYTNGKDPILENSIELVKYDNLAKAYNIKVKIDGYDIEILQSDATYKTYSYGLDGVLVVE